MRKLDFWFEYGSTYTYLSVARSSKAAAATGVQLEWHPFLLAPILTELGMAQGPFRPYPAKMAYMWRDLERRAQQHGLPYLKPSHYPPNTLLTARVGTLAAVEGWCEAFTQSCFNLHWTQDCAIGSEQNLAICLTGLHKNPAEVLARAQAPEIKERLRSATDTARALGLFGSPSFVVDRELFWGDDRLEEALDWATR